MFDPIRACLRTAFEKWHLELNRHFKALELVRSPRSTRLKLAGSSGHGGVGFEWRVWAWWCRGVD